MLKLVWTLFHDNLTIWFILHMAINLVVNVFLLPWLMYRFNKSVLDEGGSELEMYFIIGYILIKLGSMSHGVYCMGPAKERFNAAISTSIDTMINCKKSRLQFNKMKELEDGTLHKTIQKAKWPMICFVEILLATFISLFSFCGNFVWLFNISPLSVVVYTLVMVTSIALISFKERDRQKNKDTIVQCRRRTQDQEGKEDRKENHLDHLIVEWLSKHSD